MALVSPTRWLLHADRYGQRWLWVASWLLSASVAQASCKRPWLAPAAPTGYSVTVKGTEVGGVYPDALRAAAKSLGCEVKFIPFPRARISAMFAAGHADILAPVTHTAERDVHGQFVFAVGVRPALISLASHAPEIHSLDEFLANKDLTLTLVRSYDYGPQYRAFVSALEAQGRVVFDVDPQTIVRKMSAGRALYTFMASTIFYGAMMEDAKTRSLQNLVRYEALQGIEWMDSGFYLSKIAMPEDERERLAHVLREQVHSGRFWSDLSSHYPAKVLDGFLRSH